MLRFSTVDGGPPARPEANALGPEASDPFKATKEASTLIPVKRTADSPQPGSPPASFLTRSEVSKLLGVSPNTVTRWAREGRLPCHVTLGGHHRFERELVEQLQKSLYRAGNRAE
jgi:excisionase family DNA binding protein